MSSFKARIRFQPKVSKVAEEEREIEAPSFDTAIGALTRVFPPWTHAVILQDKDTGEVKVYVVLNSGDKSVFFDEVA